MNITANLLREYLSYDSETGILTWIKKPSKNVVLNSRAGTDTPTGYRVVTFMGSKIPEHRLIWCMVHGEFPKHEIDHINQLRDDNRICNLREVTRSENTRNRSRGDSRLDEVGIWYCKRRKRYIAEITLNGVKVYQKSFTDIDTAIKERKAKAKELGFHDNHGNKKQH